MLKALLPKIFKRVLCVRVGGSINQKMQEINNTGLTTSMKE